MTYWFWPTLWLVSLFFAVFWAIYKLRPTDPWKPRYKVPERPAFDPRAHRRRVLAERATEHDVWTYRFSDLQIQAQKHRLESQQEREKEKH